MYSGFIHEASNEGNYIHESGCANSTFSFGEVAVKLLSVVHELSGRKAGIFYDFNVMVLTHGAEPKRFAAFKELGLINVGDLRIHASVVCSPGDIERIPGMCDGWPDGVDVTVLEMASHDPIPKINGYYLWLSKSELNAKWHARVDDDSMTDLGEAFQDISRRFGFTAVHLATTPVCNTENGGPLFERYLLEKGISLRSTVHENESSITSEAGMRAIFENEVAVQLLIETGERWPAPGDRALAFAAHVAGVPVVPNVRSRFSFDKNDFSYFGGRAYHIHHVPWIDSEFVNNLRIHLSPERAPITFGLIERIINRPMLLVSPIGVASDIMILKTEGSAVLASGSTPHLWEWRRNQIEILSERMELRFIFSSFSNWADSEVLLNGSSIEAANVLNAKEIGLRLIKNGKTPVEANNEEYGGAPRWCGSEKCDELSREALRLTSAIFCYLRIGYDSRLMTFNLDGRVEAGKAGNEIYWNLHFERGSLCLTISGSCKTVCILKKDPYDGIWRGAWIEYERMQVALFPIDPDYQKF